MGHLYLLSLLSVLHFKCQCRFGFVEEFLGAKTRVAEA